MSEPKYSNSIIVSAPMISLKYFVSIMPHSLMTQYTILLPFGTQTVRVAKIPLLIADARWPHYEEHEIANENVCAAMKNWCAGNDAELSEAMNSPALRAAIDNETKRGVAERKQFELMLEAIANNTLKVENYFTGAPGNQDVGGTLMENLVRVEDLRKYVRRFHTEVKIQEPILSLPVSDKDSERGAHRRIIEQLNDIDDNAVIETLPGAPAVMLQGAQPQTAEKIQKHKLRTNSLDAPIKKAIRQANSLDTGEVWLKLRELALGCEVPFTGGLENGALCYTNDDSKISVSGKTVKLTKDALRRRLKNHILPASNGG